MFILRTAGWVLRHQARHPLTWLWTAVVAGLWPAVAAFSPLGVTTSATGVPPVLYEIAFVACMVGTLMGLSLLDRSAWILRRASPLRRTQAEVTVLACAMLPLLVAGLAPPWFLHAAGDAFTLGRLPAGTILSAAHVAAVALILSRLPISITTRLAALPILVWVVPSLLPSQGPVGGGVQHVLDAARHLDPERETGFPGWSWAWLPIIGLLGAAHLLARKPREQHAIRNPR